MTGALLIGTCVCKETGGPWAARVRRTVDHDEREKRFGIRMLEMVGLAAETERGFPLLRELRRFLGGATEGNSNGVGEKWPEVLVGGAKSISGVSGAAET